MKILYVTTIGSTMNFFKQFIAELVEAGHTVDVACNENATKVPDFYRELGCRVHSISTSRSPLNRGNLAAVKALRKLVAENCYDIVHCHTPVAAMCARLACRGARKRGTKVFYTAHGFHFYRGAPLKNWLLFYPIEKICSRWTDVLITINREDYALAQRKMKAKKVVYVPGVGVDLTKFGNAMVDKAAKRRELGVPEDATLLLSVGELNANKNHETIIRALAKLENNENVYYAIAGRGGLQDYLQNLAASLGLGDRVKLLGFRTDVAELYATADAFVFPSFREGLPVSVMEAMATGLPCAVSRIRGAVDLIDENCGTLFAPHSVDECRNAIAALLRGGENAQKFGERSVEKAQSFALEPVVEQMTTLYRNEAGLS
ncbi:MAG: glycosyltransferase family 4 protein [Thermoguttaceae bacterium]|nr:glycosyltransferase family 4 protein [Thermoguttaceae bacterium]